ncbi:MAG: sulfatase-like hydrolase/transferase [bacterium]|nr:sulfatase-like hydrolase/transferase [bacterium]
MKTQAQALLLGILMLAAGCSRQQTPAERVYPGAPLVLVSIDTLRSDRLPAYGYEEVETPALDALVPEAILYQRAYSHIPLTLPSHASMLTGLLPPEHGVQDNAGYTLAADKPYLPRLLRAAGYATGAAVSSFTLRGATGLDDGFELFDDAMEETAAAHMWGAERLGDRTLDAALRWLETVAERPFFLFFHLYEPHLPYNPPEPFLSRYGRSYDGEVAAADALVGRLFDELRRLELYDRAVILVLSDHGEGLMDHGESGHGIFLYREVLQVPLLLKLPGSRFGGTVVGEPAQLVDVFPTLARLAGVEVPEGVRGISLLELLDDEPPQRRHYAETYYPRIHFGWSELASLIEGDFHYLEAPEPELYNLRTDPGEKENVLRANRRIYAGLRDHLATYDRTLNPATEEDEETSAKLAALGYLAGSAADAGEGPLADPKAEMATLSDTLKTALGLFNQGRFADAVPIFQEMLADNPRMSDGWRNLGVCFERLGRYDEALHAFQEAMKSALGSPVLAIDLGKLLVKMDRPEEARAHAELALNAAPDLAAALLAEIALAEDRPHEAVRLLRVALDKGQPDPVVRRQLGLALAETGRMPEALEVLEALARQYDDPPSLNALAKVLADGDQLAEALAAVERILDQDAGNAPALETAGLIALKKGRLVDARDTLRRALAEHEKMPNAWNLLGVVLFQLQDAEGALAAWERAVELDPRQYDALYNLGISAAQLGLRSKARQALRQYIATAPPARFAADVERARSLLAELGE